jgi:hypothetical protein
LILHLSQSVYRLFRPRGSPGVATYLWNCFGLSELNLMSGKAPAAVPLPDIMIEILLHDDGQDSARPTVTWEMCLLQSDIRCSKFCYTGDLRLIDITGLHTCQGGFP